MMSELLVWRIRTEKARDTTLDDENKRNIRECCHNTHQGRYVPANKRALAFRTSATVVTLLVKFTSYTVATKRELSYKSFRVCQDLTSRLCQIYQSV